MRPVDRECAELEFRMRAKCLQESVDGNEYEIILRAPEHRPALFRNSNHLERPPFHEDRLSQWIASLEELLPDVLADQRYRGAPAIVGFGDKPALRHLNIRYDADIGSRAGQ